MWISGSIIYLGQVWIIGSIIHLGLNKRIYFSPSHFHHFTVCTWFTHPAVSDDTTLLLCLPCILCPLESWVCLCSVCYLNILTPRCFSYLHPQWPGHCVWNLGHLECVVAWAEYAAWTGKWAAVSTLPLIWFLIQTFISEKQTRLADNDSFSLCHTRRCRSYLYSGLVPPRYLQHVSTLLSW